MDAPIAPDLTVSHTPRIAESETIRAHPPSGIMISPKAHIFSGERRRRQCLDADWPDELDQALAAEEVLALPRRAGPGRCYSPAVEAIGPAPRAPSPRAPISAHFILVTIGRNW